MTKEKTRETDALAIVAQKVFAGLAKSSNWAEMQAALAEDDLEYFERGGGLAIRVRSTGAYVCKGSEVGPGYMKLIGKFRAPFPGHSAVWLAEKVLQRAPNRAV